jgi:hypothetical protein
MATPVSGDGEDKRSLRLRLKSQEFNNFKRGFSALVISFRTVEIVGRYKSSLNGRLKN